MHRTFEITAPGAPGEVLDRLARYGEDWRESKIPPALSAAGVFGCTITVNRGAFEVRLAMDPLKTRWPIRRSGWYRGRGTVQGSAADRSSRVRVRVERAPTARVVVTAWVALWLGLMFVVNRPLGVGDAALLAAVMGIGLVVFTLDLRAHGRLMRGVLEAALAGAPSLPRTA